MHVRDAAEEGLDALARVWHAAWHDAHAQIVPCELARRMRAARFCEKPGWRRAGTMINHAETASGTFPLEVWRYEKTLTA